MPILETLLPLMLIMALGYGLAHIRFLGIDFIGELSKLAFWIALPAFILRSVTNAAVPTKDFGMLAGILIACSIVVALLGWGIARLLGLSGSSAGTLAQSAYRGNIAFIGIPVLAYSFADLPSEIQAGAMSLAVLTMGPVTATFNVMAVVCLLGSQHRLGRSGIRVMVRSVVTNPLIIACVMGIILSATGIRFPVFFDRTLESLGASAVPIALLCIGGSIATVSLRGRQAAIWIAAFLKIALAPALVGLLCWWAGYTGPDLRVALVLASCPTAAAAYIMARQMGGDAAQASASIALSTILSWIPLTIILLWF